MTQQEMRFGEMTLTQTGHFTFEKSEGRFLIEKLWLRGGSGILSGPPKKGKTWLVLDAAVSVAAGVPFLGVYPTVQGPVVLYSPEGKTEELENRIAQISARKKLVQKALPLYVATSKKLTLDGKPHQEEIRALCRAVNPTLLIFDPITRCFDGIESNTDDVREATNFVNSLAAESGCAVMLTHHDSKDGTALRGSGVWLSFGDCYWFLRDCAERLSLDFAFKNLEKPAPLHLAITTENGNPCMSVTTPPPPEKKIEMEDRILAVLRQAPGVRFTVEELRELVQGKLTSVISAVNRLKAARLVLPHPKRGVMVQKLRKSSKPKPSFPPSPIGEHGKEGNPEASNG